MILLVGAGATGTTFASSASSLVQLEAAPEMRGRVMTESWAAASASIAACGVFAPDDASPMFCHHNCASFG